MNEITESLPVENTPAKLLEIAVAQNADVDNLGKLMELQERWEARQARTTFFDELSNFQADCPPIPRTKEVKKNNGDLLYKYAPMDQILKVVRDPLRERGFSFRFESEHQDNGVLVACVLHHRAGHSERSEVFVPGFLGHNTNEAQNAGGGLTYGKRYAFSNVLGLIPDDDDDAQSAGAPVFQRVLAHQAAVREHFTSVGCIKECIAVGEIGQAAAAWFELDNDAKQALWLAPTKGGIFSTSERETIKSDEFRETHFGTTTSNSGDEHDDNVQN